MAQQLLGKTVIEYQGKTINLAPPWRRWSYREAILEVNGLAPAVLTDREQALAAAKQLNVPVDPKWPLFNIVNEIFEETVEPSLSSRPSSRTIRLRSLRWPGAKMPIPR